jgi:hypothetical protein
MFGQFSHNAVTVESVRYLHPLRLTYSNSLHAFASFFMEKSVTRQFQYNSIIESPFKFHNPFTYSLKFGAAFSYDHNGALTDLSASIQINFDKALWQNAHLLEVLICEWSELKVDSQ